MIFLQNSRKGVNDMSEDINAQLMELGLNIAYYRKLKGITQAQLAQIVGISRTHISNIEAPKMPTQISVETLLKVAEALEIKTWKLFAFRSDINLQ